MAQALGASSGLANAEHERASVRELERLIMLVFEDKPGTATVRGDAVHASRGAAWPDGCRARTTCCTSSTATQSVTS